MLELSNVTLTYPDGPSRLVALNSVSMTAARGEFAAVTGPSGSGKSSLLAVASTLTTPDSGTVTIDGVDTGSLSRGEAAALRRSTLGIVFQSPHLIGSLTVADQLAIVGKMDGKTVSPEHIRELLDEVGVASAADRYPHQISGGQRQRVNIARALVGNPGLLLVDEPTSALDSERGFQIIELLRSVTTDRDVATVVVTHERDHLASFDRVWRMSDGVLTLDGERRADSPQLRAATL